MRLRLRGWRTSARVWRRLVMTRAFGTRAEAAAARKVTRGWWSW